MRSRALVVAATLVVGACGSARPSLSELAREPILQPLPGEEVLMAGRSAPRRGRVGVAGRDGAIERVVAVADPPAAVADELQRRFGDRYGFRRTDLGAGTPNTVELRGGVPGGAAVIATASTLRPVPLFSPVSAVVPVPPDRPTAVVITVISRQ